MVTDYPIRFAAQLRQHLKALRRARKLTQAQLGDLIGVSQARIAEIEANPGLVKFDQLMQVLAALEVDVTLREAGPGGAGASHGPGPGAQQTRAQPTSPPQTRAPQTSPQSPRTAPARTAPPRTAPARRTASDDAPPPPPSAKKGIW